MISSGSDYASAGQCNHILLGAGLNPLSRQEPNKLAMASVTPYVAYVFAYLNKRPAKGTLPASMMRQRQLVISFTKWHNLTILATEYAYRTNRHSHFANVPEFQKAVRLANQSGAFLLVGDMRGLLNATPVDLIPNALDLVVGAGIPVVDAATYQAVDKAVGMKIGSAAVVVSRMRHDRIKQGIDASQSVRLHSSGNKQKAALGSGQKADSRARQLLPNVDIIVAALPAGTVLSATQLAEGFNTRGVPASRGGAWSGSSAWQLYKRLKVLYPLRSWTSPAILKDPET